MKGNEAMPFLGKEELYQQLTDTKLKIALLAQQEKEIEAMLLEDNPEAQAEEKQFFATTQGRTIEKIHAQLRKQSIQRFVRHDLPRIGQAVAAILLVFYLGLTAAVATVQSVRVSLVKMLYNVEEQYTEISFQPDEDASFDVPAEWKGNYFMSYIPEGYTLEICTPKSSIDQEVIYVDDAGRRLQFAEFSLNAETNINTEGFSVSPVLINGSSGLLAENADESTVVWSTTDRYFVLNASGSAESVKRIAEMVIRIK